MSDLNYRYPFNINPQYRSQNPSNVGGCLRCPPDQSIQAIIFDCNSLNLIKGWQSKSIVGLDEFFVLCDNYLEYEISVKKSVDDDYFTLNYGNIGDVDGNVPFVFLMPLYHLTTLENDECFLNYRFKGDTEWSHLGKIFILDSTKDKPIKPIEIQNKTGEDILCRVLISN